MSEPASERPPADATGPAPDRVGDALRTAVERTLAVTADSATETRQRAQGLLDDVVRRGQVARDEVTRRGESATARLAEAIGELRAADGEDLGELRERIAGVERRLAALEAAAAARSNAQVEAESSTSKPLGQGDSGV
jgi:polyhydroxyalkanoate synthesis regulator phasin